MSKEHSFIKEVTVKRRLDGEHEHITVELRTALSSDEREWLDLVDRLAKHGVFESVDDMIRSANTKVLMEVITRAQEFIPKARLVAQETTTASAPNSSTIKKRGRKPKVQIAEK